MLVVTNLTVNNGQQRSSTALSSVEPKVLYSEKCGNWIESSPIYLAKTKINFVTVSSVVDELYEMIDSSLRVFLSFLGPQKFSCC
jgi:hypothetical protein